MGIFEFVVIDAVDHGDIGTVGRGGNQHSLGTGLYMLGGLFAFAEQTRAFQGYIHVQVFPRQPRGVAFGNDFYGTAAKVDGVFTDGYISGQGAVGGIVFQQVGVGFNRSEVVNGDHLQVRTSGLVQSPQYKAPDTPKSVDRETNSHPHSPAWPE